MKTNINHFLMNTWDTITDKLKYVCGKPTPMKRLVFVIVLGSAFTIGYVYMLANSIYNMGKRDAVKEIITNDKSPITSKDYECK